MHTFFVLAVLLLLPAVTHAQSLQTFIQGFIGFLNTVVIPFLLGVGFLFFIINAIRYFVFSSAEQEGREKAKNLATYSIAAFAILAIFWGVINLITSSIGLTRATQPTPDYLDSNAVRNSASQQNNNSPSNTPNQQPPVIPVGTPAPSPGPGNNGGGPCANGAVFDVNGQPCRNTPDAP